MDLDQTPGSQPAPAAPTAAGAGACDICGAPVRAITWRAAVGDVSQREWEAGRLLYCAGCFVLIPGVERPSPDDDQAATLAVRTVEDP